MVNNLILTIPDTYQAYRWSKGWNAWRKKGLQCSGEKPIKYCPNGNGSVVPCTDPCKSDHSWCKSSCCKGYEATKYAVRKDSQDVASKKTRPIQDCWKVEGGTCGRPPLHGVGSNVKLKVRKERNSIRKWFMWDMETYVRDIKSQEKGESC